MIVAGVGFRSGVLAEDIVALVERAMAQASLGLDQLRGLATSVRRAEEPGYRAAAGRLGVEPLAIAEEALQSMAAGVRTTSPRVLALHGVGSVAEAAALAGAGPGAELIVSRIAAARATCALARGAGP